MAASSSSIAISPRETINVSFYTICLQKDDNDMYLLRLDMMVMATHSS